MSISSLYIKGSCEHCGAAFMGEATTVRGVFEPLACPECGKQTENFDEATEVEARDKAEGNSLDYVEHDIKDFILDSYRNDTILDATTELRAYAEVFWFNGSKQDIERYHAIHNIVNRLQTFI